MDLLIINAKRMWSQDRSSLGYGAITIATYLHSKGHKVFLLDDNSQYRNYSFEDYCRFIEDKHPKMVGFSVTALNAAKSYDLARSLKNRYPNLFLIAGGFHSCDAGDEIVEQGFDIVFRGEAEISCDKFLNIIKGHITKFNIPVKKKRDLIEKMSQIPGLLFNQDGGIVNTGNPTVLENLDEIPFINFDIFNLNDFVKKKSDHHNVTNVVISQRGCPFRCNFCKSEILPNIVRGASAKHVFEELKYRYEKFGIDLFRIEDANFTIMRKKMHDFCELMISSGMSKKISLWIQSGVTIRLSSAELNQMRKANIVVFGIGVERFDNECRKKMRKAGSGEVALEFVRKVYESGIKTNLSILLNTPFESNETLERESILMSNALPFVSFFHIAFIMPFPGTEYYKKESKHYEWYLNKSMMDYNISYYENAYVITTPALHYNPFEHSAEIMTKILAFNERFHKSGGLRFSSSLVYKVCFRADLFLAKGSFYLNKISVKLERAIFAPILTLKIYGYKLFYNRFVMKHD